MCTEDPSSSELVARIREVTPAELQYVIDEPGRGARLVFQVDLFAARGEMPATLGEASEREKDIRYSSRTRLTTTYELRRRRVLG